MGLVKNILGAILVLAVIFIVVSYYVYTSSQKTSVEIRRERIAQAKDWEQLAAKHDEQKQDTWIAISKTAVKNRLRDPKSAEFKDVYFKSYDSTPMVCGTVNSNNGFGGKTGFQRFVASGVELVFLEEEVSEFNKAWKKICSQ